MQKEVVPAGDPIAVRLGAGVMLKLRPFGGGTTSIIRGPRILIGYERAQPEPNGAVRTWIEFRKLGLATLKEPDPNHSMADSLKEAWDRIEDDHRLRVRIKRAGHWEEYYQ